MVQVEIESRCNLKCKRCYRTQSKRKTGSMPLELFKEIVDKLLDSKKFKNQIYLAGLGESLLNPQFWDMVKYAKRNGCTLILPTNGTLINEDNISKFRMIDQLQISFDSFLINEKLREGSGDILRWIPELQNFRVPLQLNVQLGKDNWREIHRFIFWSIQNGVRIYFMFTTPLSNNDTYLVDEYKFCISKLNELNHIISQFVVDASVDTGCKTFKNCRYLSNDFTISWDGKLLPCNDALLMKYDFGNVKDYKNFDIFFESEEMKQVRAGNHPMCNTCKYWDNYFNSHYKPKIIYDKRLDCYHNLHKGKRGVVIGNGPSLTQEIIDEIRDEITIGANYIYRAKDKFDFEPTYCCFGDYRILFDEDAFKNLSKLKIPKFYLEHIHYQSVSPVYKNYPEFKNRYFTKKHYKFLESCIPINNINTRYNHSGLMMPNPDMISFDLRLGTLMSGTVIQDTSIPILAWMGCKEIYLVGCDLDWSKGHFYSPEKRKSNWNIGYDVIRQFSWMQKRLNEENKKLINLSPSILPDVPNIDIDEFKKLKRGG